MNEVFLINFLVAIFCGIVSVQSFKAGRTDFGWVNLLGSAANTATVLTYIF